MARNDIKLYEPIEERFSLTAVVSSGAAQSINSGEPTKVASVGAIAIMADADGTTTSRFAGIAKSDSTDTVAAAGTVTVWIPLPGLVYSAKAKTASAADTQAEIDALFGKRVIFDLTSSVWTVDTGASDASTNCLVIIGGDYQTSRINFTISSGGTFLGA